MKAQNKTKKGFTLLELMIVIVIIGILAAVSVPIILNAQRDTRNQQRASQLTAVQAAASKLALTGANTFVVRTDNTCNTAPSVSTQEINPYFICRAQGNATRAERAQLSDFFYLVPRTSNDCNNITNMEGKAIHFYIRAPQAGSTGKIVMCNEGGGEREIEFSQQ